MHLHLCCNNNKMASVWSCPTVQFLLDLTNDINANEKEAVTCWGDVIVQNKTDGRRHLALTRASHHFNTMVQPL